MIQICKVDAPGFRLGFSWTSSGLAPNAMVEITMPLQAFYEQSAYCLGRVVWDKDHPRLPLN